MTDLFKFIIFYTFLIIEFTYLVKKHHGIQIKNKTKTVPNHPI
jgi:hypothetical protein